MADRTNNDKVNGLSPEIEPMMEKMTGNGHALEVKFSDDVEVDENYERFEEEGGVDDYIGWKHIIPCRASPRNPKLLPIVKAGPFSFATCHWITSLLWKAYKKGIKPEDLYQTPRRDTSQYNAKRFEECWNIEMEKGKENASVVRAIVKLISKRLIMSIVFTFFFSAFAIIGPAVVLPQLLWNIKIDKHAPVDHTGWFAIALVVCLLLRTFFMLTYHIVSLGSGVRARGGVLSFLFKKILHLKNSKKSVGEMVNLCANDGQRLFDACSVGALIFGGLASVAGAGYAIYLLGIWGLLGFGIFILFIPLQMAIAKVTFKLRRKAIPYTDERVKLMSEVISSIKLVKMYAWEKSFASKIQAIRSREQAVLFRSMLISSLSSALPQLVPLAASALTFISMTMTNNDLTATQAFVFISLLNALRFSLGVMPLSIRALSEGKNACDRIKEILVLEEEPLELSVLQDPTNVIEMRRATFGWPAVETKAERQSRKSGTNNNKAADEKKEAELLDSQPSTSSEESHALQAMDEQDDITETLHNITFSLREGSLLGVCGSVGSGKTSLLQAILNMMTLTGGELALNREKTIAYVSQQAWIQNATVKDNILFGRDYVKDKYDHVVKVCCLEADFNQLVNGDQTEIGDRGINLSGGQKQRISIARAVYSDADVILLDDPLSAVDAHVGEHIFNQCVKGALTDKTVLFVTHQLQFLTGCDYVLVMKDGCITEEGTHTALMAGQGEYSELIKSFHETDEKDALEQPEVVLKVESHPSIIPQHPQKLRHFSGPASERRSSLFTYNPTRKQSLVVTSHRIATDGTRSVENLAQDGYLTPTEDRARSRAGSVISLISAEDACLALDAVSEYSAVIQAQQDDENEKPAGRTEKIEKGSTMTTSTFSGYVKAGGIVRFPLAIFVIAITVGMFAGTNFWLSFWIKSAGGDTLLNSTLPNGTYSMLPSDSLLDNPHLHRFVGIYAAFLMGVFFFIVLKSMMFIKVCLRAASQLHDEIFRKVVASPMSFFDVTPSGEIINRFSRDMDELDVQLPNLLGQFLNNAGQVIVSLIVIAIVFPYFLIALVVIFAAFIALYRVCRVAIRDIKRIENVTRSPLYSHIATTIQGLPTIRAYQKEKEFNDTFDTMQDVNNEALFLFSAAMRWAAVRLDTLSLLVVFITALLVTFISSDVVPPAYAALALAYSMNMTGLFQYTMRLAIDSEARFSSVERIKSYIDTLKEEAPAIITSNRPADSWPVHGAITFSDIRLRYAEKLPEVIKGITANIKPQEKIGIVGRTGSGKSSLGMALFRMVELSSGSITIDGIDISSIGLEDLRSKLSIIPQDPVLFVGTVRYNLDPFKSYNDADLWDALEKCHVRPTIENLEGQLDAPVVENGENFSVGERQLMCMARALLRHSKILLLDEATAAIDTETDTLIQRTIKEAFADCTMLTIAHRLNTVVQSDRIMVLDDGELKEFDSPRNLLANKRSMFAKMYIVQESQKHAAMTYNAATS